MNEFANSFNFCIYIPQLLSHLIAKFGEFRGLLQIRTRWNCDLKNGWHTDANFKFLFHLHSRTRMLHDCGKFTSMFCIRSQAFMPVSIFRWWKHKYIIPVLPVSQLQINSTFAESDWKIKTEESYGLVIFLSVLKTKRYRPLKHLCQLIGISIQFCFTDKPFIITHLVRNSQ